MEVELLRPLTWIEEQGFAAGKRIYLQLEELSVAGWATIRSVEQCPALSDGHSNLVTGRFVTRGATNLVEATFSDGRHNETVLNGTSIHPVWSLDRLAWVPLGELAIGEQVHSNDGPLHLVSRVARNQPTDVYNIEVDCEHVYQVGDAGILVHNTCNLLTRDNAKLGRRLGTIGTNRTPHHLVPVEASTRRALKDSSSGQPVKVGISMGIEMESEFWHQGTPITLHIMRS